MKKTLRILSFILCFSMMVTTFVTIVPSATSSNETTNNIDNSAFMTNINKINHLYKDAKNQIIEEDYTPLKDPVTYKVLWIGFNNVHYENKNYNMNATLRKRFEDGATIYKFHTEDASNNNIKIESTFHYEDKVLNLSSKGERKQSISPDEINYLLKEIAPRGKYDAIMVTAAIGEANAHLGLSYSYLNYSFMPIDHRVLTDEKEVKSPEQIVGEIYIHEWLHSLERTFSDVYKSIDLEYPGTHWPIEREEFHKYSGPNLLTYYKKVLSGKLEYKGRHIGIFPYMWKLSPRVRALDSIYLKNSASNEFLTISDPSTWSDLHHPVIQKELTEYTQRWHITPLNDNEYAFISTDMSTAYGYGLNIYNSRVEENRDIEVWSRSTHFSHTWSFVENNDGTYHIVASENNDLCMEINKNSSLKLQRYSNKPTQHWNIVPAMISNGNYHIKNRASGEFLTVSDNFTTTNHPVIQTASSSNALNSQIWSINQLNNNIDMGHYDFAPLSNPNYRLDLFNAHIYDGNKVEVWEQADWHMQQWSILPNDDGSYRILAKKDNNYCMQIDNTKNSSLSLHSYSGLSTQKWDLVPADINDGIYYLKNMLSGEYLNVSENFSDTRHPVEQQSFTARHSESSQKWNIRKLKTDDNQNYYDFAPLNNPNYRLDLFNAHVYDGNKIEVWEQADWHMQQWSILPNDDNTFRIVPKSNESYCMQIDNNKNSSLELQYYRNHLSQKWQLIKTDAIKDGVYRIKNSNNNGYMTSNKDGKVYQSFSPQNHETLWNVKNLKNGYYSFTPYLIPNFYLDVGNAANINGAPLQARGKTKYDNAQSFLLLQNPDGSIKIMSGVGDDKCIQVNSESTVNGAGLEIWEDLNTKNQNWELIYSNIYN